MTEKKINVLFIAKNIPVPGMYSSRVIMEIATRISSFSKVSFLYPKEKVPPGLHLLKKYRPIYKLQSWNCEGYDIAIYPYLRIPFTSSSYKLWNKLSGIGKTFYKDTGPYDIIHAHYLLPDGYLAYLFSQHYHLPYIITVRNADIKHLRSLKKNDHDFKKAELVIKNASRVLSLNSAYKQYIDKVFGIDSLVIPHGLDDHIYASEKNIPGKVVTITTIAEAIKRKHIDWVIRGVKTYLGEVDIRLNVIGDGPLMPELKKIPGGDVRINFTGKLSHDEVLTSLRQSDIFALPSADETFGMVYLEAAANNNALVGLINEGVWGIFEDKKEMLFCKNENDFHELLHRLISSREERLTLSENAFIKATELNWATISKEYEELYNEIIESYKSSAIA
jgi:glycosyltransferase involved in cell wall biosynthesis